MTTDLDAVRKVWARAGQYPGNKELHYPEHAAVQEFALHAGKRVFEYGCGGGADAMSYLRRGAEVWYADVVPENVAVATERIAEAGLAALAHPLVLDASWPIPLAANTMEVANCHGVLHHVEEPAPIVAELHRILRRGGLLYVMLYTEHLRANFAGQVALLLKLGKVQSEGEAFAWCTDGKGVPYARAYTEAEGRTLLEEAGFSCVAAREYNTRFFRAFKAQRP